MRLAIFPIVEGHGEDEAIRVLLGRIWLSFGRDDWPALLKPLRRPKGKLVQRQELERAVEFAALRLRPVEADGRVVLLLLDADDDCPAELGPSLSAIMRETRPDLATVCVVANVEFETWLAASADSMEELLTVAPDDVPAAPEALRLGKAWVRRHAVRGQYSPAVDQARFTSRIDVGRCRSRSPSFDRLCREIERVICDFEGRAEF